MALKKRNPMLTKSGKTRLGPLSLAQLYEMAKKSAKPKERAKIERRIFNLEKKLGYKYSPAVEEPVE